jgi:hypothetical protein
MRKVKGSLLVILTLVFSYFYFVNIKPACPSFAPCILASFICFMAYIAYELYGYPKFNDTPVQVTVYKGIVAIMIIYFIVIYVLGIFSGYVKTTYSLSTFMIIISLIAMEVFRYILINANRDSDMFPFLTTLILIVLEIASVLDPNVLISTSSLVVYLATIVTPIVIRNILLTLYVQHVNIGIAIIYSIIVLQYRSIIPIVPNLGEFTYSYAEILLSFLVLTMSYRVIIKNYEGYPMIGLKDGMSLFDFLLFFLFVVFGVLISGVTPIQMYVTENKIKNVSIEAGDAPIVIKGVNPFKLQEKDIIMYQTDNDELKIYAINTLEIIKPETANEVEVRKLYVLNEDNELYLLDNKRIKAKVLYNLKYVFKPSLEIKKYLGGGVK